LEEFVDDYYSMEKFKKAYKRVVVPLENKSFWAQIDIQVRIRVTLVKRHVGRQRKNGMKGFLEGGSGKKKSDKDKEQTKKSFQG
jgi:hypothetical protein